MLSKDRTSLANDLQKQLASLYRTSNWPFLFDSPLFNRDIISIINFLFAELNIKIIFFSLSHFILSLNLRSIWRIANNLKHIDHTPGWFSSLKRANYYSFCLFLYVTSEIFDLTRVGSRRTHIPTNEKIVIWSLDYVRSFDNIMKHYIVSVCVPVNSEEMKICFTVCTFRQFFLLKLHF